MYTYDKRVITAMQDCDVCKTSLTPFWIARFRIFLLFLLYYGCCDGESTLGCSGQGWSTGTVETCSYCRVGSESRAKFGHGRSGISHGFCKSWDRGAR